MTTNREHNQTREWLRRMAEAEDRCDSILVGGLAHDLGVLRRPTVASRWVFGRLIELSRRNRRLSLEILAQEAKISVRELLAVECDDGGPPAARTVRRLARVFGLSEQKLMQLVGLADPRDDKISQAAIRFAARLQPTDALSEAERKALEGFTSVLVDSPVGG